MSQQIDSIAVTNTQSLGADGQDDRAKRTELKYDRGVGVDAGSGVLASSPPALKEHRSRNTGASQLTDVAPRSTVPRPTAERVRGSVSSEHPTWGAVFDDTVPLISAPAGFGPPVIFLLGPWLLLVLLLVGPFALILTLLLATAVVACLLVMLVALLASPYLLIRRLRARRTVRRKPRAARHRLPKHRFSSGRFGLQEPKALSARS